MSARNPREAEAEAREWLLADGWSVSPMSMYDEEGIEGWRWDKGEREYYETGFWDEPPTVPQELLDEWRASNPPMRREPE